MKKCLPSSFLITYLENISILDQAAKTVETKLHDHRATNLLI